MVFLIRLSRFKFNKEAVVIAKIISLFVVIYYNYRDNNIQDERVCFSLFVVQLQEKIRFC